VQVKALKILTSGPGDVSELTRLMDEGVINPSEVTCIIGKTEGNGGRNDFTRDLAMLSFEELFSQRLGISREEVVERIIFSLSGGCEGVVSPHIIVFSVARSASDNGGSGGGSGHGEARSGGNGSAGGSHHKRLAIGIGFTRDFAPEEIGRMPQIEETARVIAEIVKAMKVTENSDVKLVQMKGAIPSVSYEEAEAARKSGKPMRSDMVYSRGASALAAAVALGEVELSSLSDDSVCSDWDKFSSTASCSAKPGLKRTEIMVMGNSSHWDGELVINGGVLQDMIDVNSVRRTLAGLGIEVEGQASPEQTKRLVGIFAKSEADPRGNIRGRRHVMLTDDDISDTRYSRCVLSSVIAGVTGDTAVYVSTRSEHHGPLGGGTLAIIAKA
jgi:cyanuric acid amidohydrolase